MRKIILLGVLLSCCMACVTSPLGRKQVIFVPDQQMNAMGAQAFQELKKTTPVDPDSRINQYIRCVALPITEAAKGETGVSTWDIVVFQDQSANAFALPGGKIGVHTGLLPVAKTDAQLAAVLGHEVGHVIAKHGAERMSESLVTQGGLALIDAFILGKASGDQKGLIMGVLGVGAQVGVMLPHSRTQESEADLIGLDLMARAGFDPRQSVELWKNMMSANHGAPPEWLSTHPAGENRIANLQEHLGEAMALYKRAVESGYHPKCAL